MANNEIITKRLREALSDHPKVEEKKMFGRLAFMVNGKMCLTVGPKKIMCRIDPELHQTAISKNGCRTVIMGGRKYKGFVYVDEKVISTKKELFYWVNLALEFNKKATTTPKKIRSK